MDDLIQTAAGRPLSTATSLQDDSLAPHVLVVDDSVVTRRIIVEGLSSDPSLVVTTAANGRIALAKVQQVSPDVVILDMEMPEMDGLETLKAIRTTYPRLPVIFRWMKSPTGAGLDKTTRGSTSGASASVRATCG